jgi:hypothetical protein
MKTAGLLCLLFCVSFFVCAQTDTDPPKEKTSNLPTVGIGDGILIFSGDVGKLSVAEPLYTRNGLYLELQKKSNSRTDVSLFFLTGKLYGNVSNEFRNLNFLSSITAEGLNIRYHFCSDKEKILVPYISLGIEVLSFATKSDLYDANGNQYHYWSDGTIRSLDENDPMASSAVKLKRDYVYETDLKTANLDNRSSYPTNTLSFPVGAGVKLRLSDKFHIRMAFTYHLTNTNLIDGIDETGVGQRAGSSKKDKFIYTYASLHFDLSGKDKYKPNPKIPLKDTNFDFASVPESDTDKDGVNDLADECPGTPAGIKVNAKGCPLDSDNDGIPDYRDKEPNSPAGALVDENGYTMTEEFIKAKLERDSLNEVLSHQIEMLRAKDAAGGKKSVFHADSAAVSSGNVEFDNTGRLPEDFRFIDQDKNGYISPAEMSAAIDDYLKDRSPLDKRRMHMLVDFFFDQ